MLNRSGNTTDNLCFRYRFRDVFSRFRCCVYNGTGPLLRKHNGNMELHVSATFPFTDSCNFVLWRVCGYIMLFSLRYFCASFLSLSLFFDVWDIASKGWFVCDPKINAFLLLSTLQVHCGKKDLFVYHWSVCSILLRWESTDNFLTIGRGTSFFLSILVLENVK